MKILLGIPVVTTSFLNIFSLNGQNGKTLLEKPALIFIFFVMLLIWWKQGNSSRAEVGGALWSQFSSVTTSIKTTGIPQLREA